jgi:hypothetical protein
VAFDEAHVRESIRRPGARVTAGFEPLMPAFDHDQLGDEGLAALVEFLRTLKPGDLAKLRDGPALNERLDRIGGPGAVGQPRLEGKVRQVEELRPEPLRKE